MNNNIKFAAVALCALGMSSCMIMEDSTSTNLNYPAYTTYDSNQYYMQNTYSMPEVNYKYNEAYQNQQNTITTGSPINETRSPISFRDRDQAWVSGQNPQGYTIELGEGEKASQVAQKLYKAPKNDRMAQIKYQRGSKNYYRGVYGSYSSAAEAQKALDALPAEIKNGASIKNWSNVQH